MSNQRRKPTHAVTIDRSSSFVGSVSLRALLLLFIASLAVTVGCGDTIADGPLSSSTQLVGEQPSGTTADTTPGAAKLSFSPTGATTGPRVELEPTKTGDDTFEVRVLVRSFPNLYGIAGHLRYDPKTLSLTKLTTLKMLDGGDYDGRSIGADQPKGRLLLGAARFRTKGSAYGALQGADVTKQVWATLSFKILADGTHKLAFDAATLMVKNASYEDVDTDFGGLEVTYAAATGADVTAGKGGEK